MNGLIFAYGGQWGPAAWSWLYLLCVAYFFIVFGLFAAAPVPAGAPSERNFFFGRIGASLERLTGFPGWSMAGALSCLWSLLVVVIGFYWDVAWHIDNGRDTQLFTPPHVMILVGLGGLMYSAGIAVLFATLDHADVGVRFGALRVPWSAIVLFFLGLGATVAFPLDALWHQAYGIDVTLWSPTHLQLVAGGSLGTIGVVLMCVEAMRHAAPKWLGKAIFALAVGTVLVGLSTFQGEFDYGVPQFQLLYLPILIAAAAAFALVVARLALGPGGAIRATVSYLVLRGFVAFVVHGPLHHTFPHFPLYLPTALCVEGAALLVGERDRLRFALVAGALAGTVGLFCEMLFVGLTYGAAASVSQSLAIKAAILGPIVAISAAVIGAGFAKVFGHHDDRMPVAAMAAAGLAILIAFAYPLPRKASNVTATIRLQPVGYKAIVDVTLSPANAAHGADAFNVVSWQGGGRIDASFSNVGPGEYRTSTAVPITGRWKTTVNLVKGDEVMAAPVYFPADPAIGAVAIPAQAVRTTPFLRITRLTLREKHPGPAYVATLAYLGVGTSVLVWVFLMALTVSRLGSRMSVGETANSAAGGEPPLLFGRPWLRGAAGAASRSPEPANSPSPTWGPTGPGWASGSGSGSPWRAEPAEPGSGTGSTPWNETPWRQAIYAGTRLSAKGPDDGQSQH